MQQYLPLLQSLVWPILIVVLILKYRNQIDQMLDILLLRLKQGSSLKAGPFELGELGNLEYKPPPRLRNGYATTQPSGCQGKEAWIKERTGVYESQQGFFLTHVLSPSEKDPDGYEVFIYLLRHQRNDAPGPHDLSEVVKAEFFLGHMWGDRVFEVKPEKGMVGMATSAYGPFLCVCHVHLQDGSVIRLNRYIDFEMGKRVFPRSR